MATIITTAATGDGAGLEIIFLERAQVNEGLCLQSWKVGEEGRGLFGADETKCGEGLVYYSR